MEQLGVTLRSTQGSALGSALGGHLMGQRGGTLMAHPGGHHMTTHVGATYPTEILHAMDTTCPTETFSWRPPTRGHHAPVAITHPWPSPTPRTPFCADPPPHGAPGPPGPPHLDEVPEQLVGLGVGLLDLLELVSQPHGVGLEVQTSALPDFMVAVQSKAA
ncbi:hypothetical protein DV515_00019388 [Chloebia gouldiae]|uniref:Uncharacterized protein n=1 Tax=Chloebia gouldiae TaxID=44316 RepID=A0A3L8Q590_CHLGU|nr:hypothetical protein DV515_00019388 [Chloebia gouldiae]